MHKKERSEQSLPTIANCQIEVILKYNLFQILLTNNMLYFTFDIYIIAVTIASSNDGNYFSINDYIHIGTNALSPKPITPDNKIIT